MQDRRDDASAVSVADAEEAIAQVHEAPAATDDHHELPHRASRLPQ